MWCNLLTVNLLFQFCKLCTRSTDYIYTQMSALIIIIRDKRRKPAEMSLKQTYEVWAKKLQESEPSKFQASHRDKLFMQNKEERLFYILISWSYW